ncbi:MAG TPA: PKD domain-containing protein [Saprospiraceae bacterium]|nr:PKD domain-containing protein [Saprospiraceae bacterium]HMQ85837.1 PKD domain-containing protein [Saprospiraceae bacterium]
MKKNVLIALLTICAPLSLLTAQITIEVADAPTIGLTLTSITDTMPADIGPGAAGANQEWFFTDLAAHLTAQNNIIDPNITPYVDQFPTANGVFESGGVLNYFRVSGSALEALGTVLPFPGLSEPLVAPFDPVQLVIPFPLEYGDAYETSYGFELLIDGSAFGADSVYIKRRVQEAVEIDGWGTVQTDIGTFDVLRKRTDEYAKDSIAAKIFGFWVVIQETETTATVYDFIGKNGITSVVNYRMGQDGSVTITALSDLGSLAIAPVAAFGYEAMEMGVLQFTDLSANSPTEWLWTFGDGTTSTEQNPVHTYLENDTYMVCLNVTNEAGEDIACQEIEVVVTGIHESSISKSIQIFPNPSSGLVTIDWSEVAGFSPLSLKVLNAQGQLVVQQALQSAEQRKVLDMTGLHAGLYTLLLHDAEGRPYARTVVVSGLMR